MFCFFFFLCEGFMLILVDKVDAIYYFLVFMENGSIFVIFAKWDKGLMGVFDGGVIPELYRVNVESINRMVVML